MSEEPKVCEECGDDLVAEGHRFCLECLEAGAEDDTNGASPTWSPT